LSLDSSPSWAQSWKIYFYSSKIDLAPEDVSYLGWLLEEHIDWKKVADKRKDKRKAQGKRPPRAKRRALQSSRSKDPLHTVRTESEAEVERESEAEKEAETGSAQGSSRRTAGKLPRF
jgi:hypothetical protein